MFCPAELCGLEQEVLSVRLYYEMKQEVPSPVLPSLCLVKQKVPSPVLRFGEEMGFA